MNTKMKIFIIMILVYISLGLPDGVLGAAWPEMHKTIGVGVSLVAVVSNANIIVSFCSSLLYPYIIKRTSFINILIFSMTMTIISLILFSISTNLLMLIISAMVLGLGGGLIDTSVNDYATKNFNVSQVNILHGTWGIGISLGSFIVALVFTYLTNFRIAYIIVALIQIVFLIFIFKSRKNLVHETKEEEVLDVDTKAPKRAVFSFLYYFFYGYEFVFVLLLSTYGKEIFDMSSDKAAFLTTLFLIGITIGRFSILVFSKYLSTYNILKGCIFTLMIIVGLTLFNINIYIISFVTGLFMGPLYPSMMAYSTEIYPKKNTSKIISINVSSALLGSIVLPLFYSYTFNIIGFESFFLFFFISLVVVLISLLILHKYRNIK